MSDIRSATGRTARASFSRFVVLESLSVMISMAVFFEAIATGVRLETHWEFAVESSGMRVVGVHVFILATNEKPACKFDISWECICFSLKCVHLKQTGQSKVGRPFLSV